MAADMISLFHIKVPVLSDDQWFNQWLKNPNFKLNFFALKEDFW